MTIHDAIDHAMDALGSSIGTSFFDGVLAPENEFRAVSPDISHHVPFIALFYRGNPELAKTLLQVWQTAAHRHWGFWLRHDPELKTLKLYTFKDEKVPVQNALWYIQEDYSPKSDGSNRFWKALIATGQFLLLLRDKNDPIPKMIAISLKRVCNDEFVAVDVGDLPADLATSMDIHEEEMGRTN